MHSFRRNSAAGRHAGRIVAGLVAGLSAAALAGPAGWEHSFRDPLPPNASLTDASSLLDVEGNTRFQRTQGTFALVTFTNILVNVGRYPTLHLEVPDTESSWSLSVAAEGAPLVCVHSSSAPGVADVDLARLFGWGGETNLTVELRLSEVLTVRRLALLMPRGWTTLDNFDSHDWVSEFTSTVFRTSPYYPEAPEAWMHECVVTRSRAHPAEGDAALRVSTPICTNGAITYNYVYFKSALPQPEDWSAHEFVTFDALMENGPLGNPECSLTLKNALGETCRVPLFINWRLFQFESRQMAFPLQGNAGFVFPDIYTTNYHVSPVPEEILTNVTEVILGVEQYEDGMMTNNYVHFDNLRFDSTQLWDRCEGRGLRWSSTNPAVTVGITRNETFGDSAGALYVGWAGVAGGVRVHAATGTWADNWHAWTGMRARVRAAQTGTRLQWAVNGRTTDTVQVDAVGTWRAATWAMPTGITEVTNVELRIQEPSTGELYVDDLELGAVPDPVGSARGWALRDVNRLAWTVAVTDGVESIRVRYRTDAPPTNAADGVLAATLPPPAAAGQVFDHGGVLDNTTYYYAVFARYEDEHDSAVSDDASVAVPRRFVTAGQGDCEAAFSTDNGALLYLHDTAAGTTLSAGNEDRRLWKAVFLNETTPDLYASSFAPGRPGMAFSYTEGPLVLSYRYTNDGGALCVDVAVDDTVPARLVMKMTVTNRLAEAIRTVALPHRLLFASTNVDAVVFPMTEGVAFTRDFFLDGRYTYQPRPWLSADFIGLDSSDGLLSLFAVQDSLCDADVLPGHDPVRPVYQPANLGVGGLPGTPAQSFMDYEIVTCVPTGRSWTSASVVLQAGGGSIRDALADYRALNGFTNSALYPTLQQKLDAFGLFDRAARGTVLAVEASQLRNLHAVPDGQLWATLRDDWLEDELPRDAMLHFTHWQELVVEDKHPDCLPTWTNRYGPKADLTNLLAYARGRGWLAMPFSNWTVWNKPELVVWDWSLGLRPIPESCRRAFAPDAPFFEYSGYMVKPWHTNVAVVHSNMMSNYTTNYPMDAMFVDMTCERSWRYTRLDEDDDGEEERVFTGFTQATIDHNRYLKQFFPLFTEGVFDHMMGEVSGYCQSMRQKYFLDLVAHIGTEFSDWTLYPLAADLAHENVGFYQHDLTYAVFPNTKALLTHYTVVGYNYVTDVASWLGRESPRGENWMYICDAFQKSVASKSFGRKLNVYEAAVGGDPRIIRTSYGEGTNELTILANFYSNAMYAAGAYGIAPEGFLATLPGDRVIAGLFTNTFNGAALSAGEHYIACERVSAAEIVVRQPYGADTELRVPKPAAWGDDVLVRAVGWNGFEMAAQDRLLSAQGALVLDVRASLPGCPDVAAYRVLQGAEDDWPPCFLEPPVLETESATQVWCIVRASKPVSAVVAYGIAGPDELAVTNAALALAQAVLVPLPVAGTGYVLRVTIADAAERTAVSDTLEYPAGGLAWHEDFEGGRGAWRDETTDPGFWATLTVADGEALVTAPAETAKAKILSGVMTVDLDDYPILEIGLPEVDLGSGSCSIGLQEEVSPWAATGLYTTTRSGRMILNIPERCGWSGPRTFSVEISIKNTDTVARSVHVDDIKLRRDSRVAWVEECEPLRRTWQSAYKAAITNNGDGTADLVQGDGDTWGWVWSERIVLNTETYPWMEASITHLDASSAFKLNVNYSIDPLDSETLAESLLAPFTGSGRLDPARTAPLDETWAALVIEGAGHTATVERVLVAKHVPGQLRLAWNTSPSRATLAAGTPLWIPVTAVDYAGGAVQYSAEGLPAGAAYDGILAWTPGTAHIGTHEVSLLAGNASATITNRIVLRVTSPDAVVLDLDQAYTWGVYRTTITSHGDGTATQIESGPDTWGKAWVDLGEIDLDHLARLHVQLSGLASGCVILALSGPVADEDYTEFGALAAPGDYAVDVSSWPGNGEGTEHVVLQFVLVGNAASATYAHVELEPAIVAPDPIVLDLDGASGWGVYQVTMTFHGNGTATEEETGPDVWGKAWVDLGDIELDHLAQLHVELSGVAGGYLALALSGPVADEDYTEFAALSAPGDYLVDVNPWIGNEAGTEHVVLQFVIVGQASSATYTRVALEPWPDARAFLITAAAGPNGTITPTGGVKVVSGAGTSFVAAADAYYHVAQLLTNGAPDIAATNRAVYTSAWANVTMGGTVEVAFAENLCPYGTPEWWLAAYRLTNEPFGVEETNDVDGDTFTARDEWIALTDPTNDASFFHAAAVFGTNAFSTSFDGMTARVYSLEHRSSLLTGGWLRVSNQTNVPGLGTVMSLTHTNLATSGFYRVNVALP